MNNATSLTQLLTRGLPLSKVGPTLRDAARRAVQAEDVPAMRKTAGLIVKDLLRRGALLRASVEGDSQIGAIHFVTRDEGRLVDLSVLGPEMLTKPQVSPVDNSGLGRLLEVIEGAQSLNVGDPRSGEVGEILDSILDLLHKYSPQYPAYVMLFRDMPEGNTRKRVFPGKATQEGAPWLAKRRTGQAVFIPQGELLPEALFQRLDSRERSQKLLAMPLYRPALDDETGSGPEETGLLFILGLGEVMPDHALQLGAKLSRFVTHRWSVHETLNRLIHVDALTGLYNRHYLDAQLDLLVERARRKKASLAMIIADIDWFKTINTEYGLMAGDQVLQTVAQRLKEEVRQVDVVCRRGGEEFGIILPEADTEAAQEVITRLLDAKFEAVIRHQGKRVPIAIRFSYGVSIFPDNAVNAGQLHFQAEQMEKFSKDRGRDRAHFFQNDGMHREVLPEAEAP